MAMRSGATPATALVRWLVVLSCAILSRLCPVQSFASEVATSAQLGAAIDRKDAHIVITAHLYLSEGYTCPPEKDGCDYKRWRLVAGSTLSIQGSCSGGVLPELEPPIPKLKPLQCVIFISNRMFDLDGLEEGNNTEYIYVSNLFIRALKDRGVAAEGAFFNMMGSKWRTTWFFHVTWQGDGDKVVTRGIDPYQEAKVYMKDCEFLDIEAEEGTVASPNKKSTMVFEDCLFARNVIDKRGLVWIINDSNVTVVLRNMTLRDNSGDVLFKPTESAGEFYATPVMEVAIDDAGNQPTQPANASEGRPRLPDMTLLGYLQPRLPFVDASGYQEPTIGVNLTTARTGSQLLDALRAGEPYIQLRQHLDLRTNNCSSWSCAASTSVGRTTQGLQGNCEAVVPPVLAPAGGAAPLKPLQCLLRTEPALFSFEFSPKVWLSNLYVSVSAPGNATATTGTVFSASLSKLWFTNVTVQGPPATSGPASLLAVDLQGTSAHFADCTFSGLRGPEGVVLLLGSSSSSYPHAHLQRCRISDCTAEPHGLIFTSPSAAATVALQNTTFDGNTGAELALGASFDGRFYTDNGLNVLVTSTGETIPSYTLENATMANTTSGTPVLLPELDAEIGYVQLLMPTVDYEAGQRAGSQVGDGPCGPWVDCPGLDQLPSPPSGLGVWPMLAIALAAALVCGVPCGLAGAWALLRHGGYMKDLAKLNESHASVSQVGEAPNPVLQPQSTISEEQSVTPSTARSAGALRHRVISATGAPASEVLKTLSHELESMGQSGKLFAGRFAIMPAAESRVGGQGLVQFMRMISSGQDVAVKFFFSPADFERHRDICINSDLQALMPSVYEVNTNQTGRARSPSGYVFPPFIISERGQTLLEFAQQPESEFVTVIHALLLLAKRLEALHHKAGWVHRQLQPAYVLRMPQTHSWALIGFGNSRRIGETAPVQCVLPYAAPEAVGAVESHQANMEVQPALDVWAFGLIAWELLTSTNTFQGMPEQEVRDRIVGRKTLPWEEMTPASNVMLEKLRRLRGVVLPCLERDPYMRPTSEDIVSSMTHMFDSLTTVTMTVT